MATVSLLPAPAALNRKRPAGPAWPNVTAGAPPLLDLLTATADADPPAPAAARPHQPPPAADAGERT